MSRRKQAPAASCARKPGWRSLVRSSRSASSPSLAATRAAGPSRWPTLRLSGLANTKTQGGDDATEAAWIKTGDSIDLAFDHAEILNQALAWLRRGVIDRTLTLALRLLPRSFHVEDVHALFQELGLTRRQAAIWLRRMVQSGRIERVAQPFPHFHLVESTR